MPHDVLDALKPSEDEMIAIRRDIHKHPETAFEEVRTADIVAAKLTEWGIPIHRGLATTGVVGTLKGARPGQKWTHCTCRRRTISRIAR
jgi:metal-dependent amidase/aminoacylase/carboxypeptidase family protein